VFLYCCLYVFVFEYCVHRFMTLCGVCVCVYVCVCIAAILLALSIPNLCYALPDPLREPTL
jgi:hypothetical protein